MAAASSDPEAQKLLNDSSSSLPSYSFTNSISRALKRQEERLEKEAKQEEEIKKVGRIRYRAVQVMNYFKKKGVKEQDDDIDGDSEDDIALRNTQDVMHYSTESLTTWASLLVTHGTIVGSKGVALTLFRAIILATIVALVMIMLPNSDRVSPDRFSKLGSFLSVFVGLLLGFFISSSMTRWYSSANSLLELYDAVRKLQMQCFALGVDAERETLLARYGVLSAWLLHYELRVNDSSDSKEMMWKKFDVRHEGLVLPEEKEVLQACDEPCIMIWTWVASLVGRMAQDGDIPPMASPTYGRILNLVQMAYDSIRSVRANNTIQTPFIYVHLLSLLVHTNIILNAFSFGLTSGTAAARILDSGSTKGEIARGLQALVTSFVLSMVAPLLYVALLEVALYIALPFQNDKAIIPTQRLVARLERDLNTAKKFSDSPPFWDKPRFKK